MGMKVERASRQEEKKKLGGDSIKIHLDDRIVVVLAISSTGDCGGVVSGRRKYCERCGSSIPLKYSFKKNQYRLLSLPYSGTAHDEDLILHCAIKSGDD